MYPNKGYILQKIKKFYELIRSESLLAVKPNASATFFPGPLSPNLLIVNKSFFDET